MSYVLAVTVGLGSGFVIGVSTAAFLVITKLVNRVADKTRTKDKLNIYEMALLLGGIAAVFMTFWEPRIPLGGFMAGFIGLMAGIFTGILAASLAEILKVIPVFTRRAKVADGLFWFVIALAGGKVCGTLVFYLMQGFH